RCRPCSPTALFRSTAQAGDGGRDERTHPAVGDDRRALLDPLQKPVLHDLDSIHVTFCRVVAYTGRVNATSWADRTTVGRETESFAAAAEAHLDDVYAYLPYLTGDQTVAQDPAPAT